MVAIDIFRNRKAYVATGYYIGCRFHTKGPLKVSQSRRSTM